MPREEHPLNVETCLLLSAFPNGNRKEAQDVNGYDDDLLTSKETFMQTQQLT